MVSQFIKSRKTIPGNARVSFIFLNDCSIIIIMLLVRTHDWEACYSAELSLGEQEISKEQREKKKEGKEKMLL